MANNALHLTPPARCLVRTRKACQRVSQVSYGVRLQDEAPKETGTYQGSAHETEIIDVKHLAVSLSLRNVSG